MTELLIFPDDTLPPHLDAAVLGILRYEYPTLVTEGAPRSSNDPRTNSTLLLLVDGDAVLSYLAIPSKLLRHAGETYRASGLSSVITNPHYRRQGYGRRIVTAAYDLIATSDADIGIFTCDPPLVDFYTQCGWTLMERTSVIGGTRAKPFPADALNKRTLMGFFSDKARQHRAAFENATIHLELREGDLW